MTWQISADDTQTIKC
jgi:hypothetical protein